MSLRLLRPRLLRRRHRPVRLPPLVGRCGLCEPTVSGRRHVLVARAVRGRERRVRVRRRLVWPHLRRARLRLRLPRSPVRQRHVRVRGACARRVVRADELPEWLLVARRVHGVWAVHVPRRLDLHRLLRPHLPKGLLWPRHLHTRADVQVRGGLGRRFLRRAFMSQRLLGRRAVPRGQVPLRAGPLRRGLLS